MGTFISSDVTSRPSVAISGNGLNGNYGAFLFQGTASGSQNFVLLPMPAGARILDMTLSMSGAISAGAQVRVIDSINSDVYISSATALGAHVHRMNAAAGVFAKRLTASANLIAVLSPGGDAASAAASLNFKLVCSYLTVDTGD